MDKAIEILLYINELYGDDDKIEIIYSLPSSNSEKYSLWQKSFEDYSLEEVKSAIRKYWKYKNNRTAPKVSHLLAYLEEDNKVETKSNHVTEAAPVNREFIIERMSTDIKAGNCFCNLYNYQRAEDIVLSDYLLQEIPTEVWNRMSRGLKMKVAMEKGCYNRFDEALRFVCKQRYGVEYEFESENIKKSIQSQTEFSDDDIFS